MFHNYDMIQFVSGTQLDFYFFSLAGVVVKEETRELLVIQERNSSVSCVPCYTSLVPFNKFCDLILQVDTIQYKYVSSALHMISSLCLTSLIRRKR
mgnify:CR=1 FL=1